MKRAGKFIVLYAANNLGKSTQLDLLEESWKEVGRPYVRIKYPRYESQTGILINKILRPKNEAERIVISDADLQALYAEDRWQYETELLKLLDQGDVFAEDYVGTGIAWGLTKGVCRKDLNLFNLGLLEPDIAILLDGERFGKGIERGHRFEGAGQETWEENRRIHLELAREFGWEIVSANNTEEKVRADIMEIIRRNW